MVPACHASARAKLAVSVRRRASSCAPTRVNSRVWAGVGPACCHRATRLGIYELPHDASPRWRPRREINYFGMLLLIERFCILSDLSKARAVGRKPLVRE